MKQSSPNPLYESAVNNSNSQLKVLTSWLARRSAEKL
jgi:hypothetical protein